MIKVNKASKYILYAIGEIVLVVIGILIALSINNWNTFRVNNNLADGYRQDLIDELKVDLKSIDSLNKKTTRTQNDIKHYLKILNQEPVNMDSIKITLKNLFPVVYWFNSSSYSIDELITTGNISLLNKSEKNSILKLKKTFEINMEYIREASRFWTNLLDREKESMDHLYFSGFSSKEHISVKIGWTI